MLQVRHEGQRVEWRMCESLREFENYQGTKAELGVESRRVYVQKPPEVKPRIVKRPPKEAFGEKLRFRVKISWFGELHEAWTYAYTKEQALCQAARRLAPYFRYRYEYVKDKLFANPQWWEASHE